jgi:hypothetical protein
MPTPVTPTPLPVDALVTFDETTRTVLEELSETVASALAGIGRKNALVSPTVVRTEYDITGPTFVLTRLAREVAAAPENTQAGASGDGDGTSEPELTYRGRARQTEDGTEVFVAVERALTSTVVAAADRLVIVTDAQAVTEDEHWGVVRVWLSEPFFALGLADHGAVLRSVTATPDSVSVVVNVPDGVTVGEISEFVRTRFEGCRSTRSDDSTVTSTMVSPPNSSTLSPTANWRWHRRPTTPASSSRPAAARGSSGGHSCPSRPRSSLRPH